VSSGTGAQVWLLVRRSVKRTLRQPALIVPSIVFPLVLLAMNASGLSSATKIPGFPAKSYLDFALTVTFMQGALFASITAGTELATDIQSGFFNRLQLTPLRGVAVLVGQLGGAVVVALVGALVYLSAGLIAGAEIKAGPGGALFLIFIAILVAFGFGALGLVLAIRVGTPEAVQGLFPLLFATFFLSSMSMPRNLMPIDWFRTAATWNPVSYLVESMRSLVISGWDWTALGKGLGVAAALIALAFAGSVAALRTRMART
jgi:ABC-2 type transport system permease protein